MPVVVETGRGAGILGLGANMYGKGKEKHRPKDKS